MLAEIEVDCGKHGKAAAHLSRDGTALCQICWDEAWRKAEEDPEIKQRIHKEVARNMLGISLEGRVGIPPEDS